ncbi:hypothetical protein Enr13x_34360 [Stieleria neptunia]|uniref:Uncharacterized protein n=1 Tax=Stieleria neptunia TaxID=2527979 RepID=A0A518HRV0_9BACT|nr:hypothetical protein [Stieleria neptunia]QDV43579.1 hypothetical protein Enr13x_34360 [Stieleria neptunia]
MNSKVESIVVYESSLPQFLDTIVRAAGAIYHDVRALSDAVEQSSYEDRVNQIRERYPNAYTAWTKEEDLHLSEKHRDGKTIDELAVIFQRQPNAIRSRLKKLESNE